MKNIRYNYAHIPNTFIDMRIIYNFMCVNTEHKRKERKNHNQILARFDQNGRISGILNVLYTFYIFIRI